jgi:DNA replication protein DnaC
MSQQELNETLRDLRLTGMRDCYSDNALIANREGKTYEEYLLSLARHELEERQQRRIKKLKRDAKLPLVKDLDTYDFSSVGGITAKDVQRLATGEFVKKAANVVFYGSFGLGKTHLAIVIIQDLCNRNYKCYFTSTSALIEGLIEAKKDLRLSEFWKKLDKFDLIACDELGYIPESKEGADLFFQFISQRYERKSILITTNLTYSEWGKVFLNEITTAAAVDRIIHNCETFSLTGPSKRLADARKKLDMKDD